MQSGPTDIMLTDYVTTLHCQAGVSTSHLANFKTGEELIQLVSDVRASIDRCSVLGYVVRDGANPYHKLCETLW